MKKLTKDQGLAIVIITTFLYFFTSNLSTSIIARYSRELGMEISQVGMVWSITFIAAVFFRPIAGHYGDKISSFSMMAFGSILLGISNAIYMIAQTSFGLSIGRFLNGVSNAFFVTTSIAAASLVVPIDRSSVALSYRAAAVSLGSLLAPPVAGYISDIWGYSLAFEIAIVTAFINAGLCIFYRNNLEKPSDDHLRNASWKNALNSVVILATLVGLFGGGVFSGFRGLLQTHYSDLGYPGSYYGLVMAMFSGVTTIIRLIVPKLIGKNPSKAYLLALLGYTLVFIATGLLFVLYIYPMSYIVTALYGIGFGLTVPTIQHLISYYTERGVRNRAMAIYAIGFDVGGFVGGLLFSNVAELRSYTDAYLAMTSFPFINIVIMIFYMLKYRNTLTSRS